MTDLRLTGVLQLHIFLQSSSAALYDVLHLKVAGSRQVVYDLLWVELQDSSVARLKQITHHCGAVQHRHLEKNHEHRTASFNLNRSHNLTCADGGLPEAWTMG